jgi:hypothetical protein
VSASVSRTGNLVKPDFKHQAVRFIKWRKKRPKPKKPKALLALIAKRWSES